MTTSRSEIRCAENDPGSIAYVKDATPEQRALWDSMADGTFWDSTADGGTVSTPVDECSSAVESVPWHVMVDIETMSLHPHKALILSIGLVEFNPEPLEKPLIGRSLLILPDIMEQLTLRRVDPGTQEFWRKQPHSASMHWRRGGHHGVERDSIRTAADKVRDFCAAIGEVWANGTQFDLSNLIGLAEDAGQTEPLWHYRAPRDMRTFCEATPQTRIMDIGKALAGREGVEHEPIYDCMVQIYHVWEHWQK